VNWAGLVLSKGGGTVWSNQVIFEENAVKDLEGVAHVRRDAVCLDSAHDWARRRRKVEKGSQCGEYGGGGGGGGRGMF
jgi:hypothetical protein